jgi:hypothetical protein
MKSGEAEILIVYQKEPHAGQLAFREVAQPESLEARIELAKKMKTEFEMPMKVLVDTMEDQSRALFSDLPSPVFIIDAKGVIREKFPWPESEQISQAVSELINQESKRTLNPVWLFAIVIPIAILIATRKKQTNEKIETTESTELIS